MVSCIYYVSRIKGIFSWDALSTHSGVNRIKTASGKKIARSYEIMDSRSARGTTEPETVNDNGARGEGRRKCSVCQMK